VNDIGYLLQAGDETPTPYSNNLDSAVITGNMLKWNGVNKPNVLTHGLFTGYSVDITVKYNYIDRVPYAILFKSGTDQGQNMTFKSGGCAYNIVKNVKFAVRIKGINGVRIVNNTFYSADGQLWYFIFISSNGDRAVPAPSTGTKIFNNIFYTTIQVPMIKIEKESLKDFESDYNVFWCASGEPRFAIDENEYSFAEWKAMGYDTHSVVYNPDFADLVNFIPARLDVARDLGGEFRTGLSTNAKWDPGVSPELTDQDVNWQPGAVLYSVPAQAPFFQGAAINTQKADIIDLTFDTELAGVIPPASAFKVYINSVAVQVKSVSVSENKVLVALNSPVSNGDFVTISYSRPSSNKIRSTSGGQAADISTYDVKVSDNPYSFDTTNVHIYPNPARNFINIKIQQPSMASPVIRIFDNTGRLCLEKKLEPLRDFHQILVNLRTGIYLVQVVKDGSVSTKKILITGD
jgi:uncharacterized repeat protein (TIGR02059 family)